FLVGMEGQDGKLELLRRLSRAVLTPEFPIGLGRRSYVPSKPIGLRPLGLRESTDMEDALLQPFCPIAGKTPPPRQRPPTIRLVLESRTPADYIVNDQPTSRAFETRAFYPRYVETKYVPLVENDSAVGIRIKESDDVWI